MRGNKWERILRVLLNTKEALSKNELSKRSECTRQWVIRFLRVLEKEKLVNRTKVTDKRKLLEFWINLSKKKNKFRSYMIKEPLELLKKSRLDYALTTYQAENIMQHYLFPSRIDIYIREPDLDRWHVLMTKNGLYGKGNVRIIIADPHTMYGKRNIKGLSIVSLPQLIVDLTKEGGPCEEAAEMLIKNV